MQISLRKILEHSSADDLVFDDEIRPFKRDIGSPDQSKAFLDSPVTLSKISALRKAAKKTPEAFVKVTFNGGIKNASQGIRQLNYLTSEREGEVTIATNDTSSWDFEEITSKDAHEAISEWAEEFRGSPKNGHTTHLILSFPKGADRELAHEAAGLFAEEVFGVGLGEDTFEYIAVTHRDQDHPHTHFIVKNRGTSKNEWFSVKSDGPYNIPALREAQVRAAEQVGIELTATLRIERGLSTRDRTDAAIKAERHRRLSLPDLVYTTLKPYSRYSIERKRLVDLAIKADYDRLIDLEDDFKDSGQAGKFGALWRSTSNQLENHNPYNMFSLIDDDTIDFGPVDQEKRSRGDDPEIREKKPRSLYSIERQRVLELNSRADVDRVIDLGDDFTDNVSSESMISKDQKTDNIKAAASEYVSHDNTTSVDNFEEFRNRLERDLLKYEREISQEEDPQKALSLLINVEKHKAKIAQFFPDRADLQAAYRNQGTSDYKSFSFADTELRDNNSNPLNSTAKKEISKVKERTEKSIRDLAEKAGLNSEKIIVRYLVTSSIPKSLANRLEEQDIREISSRMNISIDHAQERQLDFKKSAQIVIRETARDTQNILRKHGIELNPKDRTRLSNLAERERTHNNDYSR